MQTLRSRKTLQDVNMLVDAGTLRVSAGELELVNGPRLWPAYAISEQINISPSDNSLTDAGTEIFFFF